MICSSPAQRILFASFLLAHASPFCVAPSFAMDEKAVRNVTKQTPKQKVAEKIFNDAVNYLQGSNGVRKNLEKALTGFRVAADAGHRVAQNNYAVMRQEGLGGQPVDLEEALTYYTLSADQEYKDAQVLCADMFYQGRGGPVDKEKALKYLKLAALQGDTPSAVNAVSLLLERPTQDQDEMLQFLRLAIAEKNNPVAIKAYFNYFVQHRIPFDEDAPFKELKKLAKKDKTLLFLYAAVCDCRRSPEGLKEARRCYEELAPSDLRAAHNLGCMYISGEGGKQNSTEALRHFKFAADLGFAASQFAYATILLQRNEKISEIREYFQKAAEQGHTGGMICLHLLNTLEAAETSAAPGKQAAAAAETTAEDKMEIDLTSIFLTDEVDSPDEEEVSVAAAAPSLSPIPAVTESEVPSSLPLPSPVFAEKEATAPLSPQGESSVWNPELIEELEELAARNQAQIEVDRLKKQTQKQVHLTLTVSRADYDQTTTQMTSEITRSSLDLIKQSVERATLDLVQTIFGQGDQKINSFTNEKAHKAFRNLGCTVEDKLGQNSTVVTFALEGGRVIKLTYHNPHGRDGTQLYNALKPRLKRFLLTINKTPETLEVK